MILFLLCRSGHVSREMAGLIHLQDFLGGRLFWCCYAERKARLQLCRCASRFSFSMAGSNSRTRVCIKSMPGGSLIDAARKFLPIVVNLDNAIHRDENVSALQYYRFRTSTYSSFNVVQSTVEQQPDQAAPTESRAYFDYTYAQHLKRKTSQE